MFPLALKPDREEVLLCMVLTSFVLNLSQVKDLEGTVDCDGVSYFAYNQMFQYSTIKLVFIDIS